MMQSSPLPLLLPTILLFLLLEQSHQYAFTSIESQLSSGLIGSRTRAITIINTNQNGGSSTHCSSRSRHRHCRNHNISMKDLSSSNVFQIGERVKVVSSVYKAGIDLNGRTGTVKETWEKCDVDPTCCCAEFVDENFAVTVKFDGSLTSDSDSDSDSDSHSSNGIGGNGNTSPTIGGLNDYFTHFFSEDELIHVKGKDKEEEIIDNKDRGDVNVNFKGESNTHGKDVDAQPATAFDGMSCTAFKLDQLKMGKQAKRIAAYESSLEANASANANEKN